MSKAEYEFEVTEPMITSTTFIVRASTRAEALEKVLNNEIEESWTNSIAPTRSMNLRDVKRLARVDSVQP